MAKAEGSMVINRSASDIFAFLTDIEKGTEWQAELVESRHFPRPLWSGHHNP